MASFTGWLGLGALINGNGIVEPADSGYARQPLSLTDLSPFGPSYNVGQSIFGPWAAAVGPLPAAALFDAVGGGNCLLLWSWEKPVLTVAGHSVQAPPVLLDLDDVSAVLAEGKRFYAAGAQVGRLHRGQSVVAGSSFTFTV